MRVVFVDTVGLIAVWDAREQWHAKASEVYHGLLATNTRMVTTTYVLLECGNAAARRPYRNAVVALRRELLSSGLLIEPDAADCASAWSRYERRECGDAGIVDHVSFQVMRRLGITEAFTNDGHFAAAGIQVLF